MKLSTDDLSRFIGRYSLGRDSNPLNPTDSLHFLRVKVPGGFLDSTKLRRIAELTRIYSRGQAAITNRQDIQLHWIGAKDALRIFSVMDEIGFTTDMCGQGFSGARYGDPRNIVCCPVSGIDRSELLNGASLLHELSDFFIGNLEFQDMPRKFKFSISGCGCDCTRAVTNDLAFVAVERKEDVGFTILAGGSMGASLPGPRLAQQTGVFIRPEEAFDVAVAAIELHRDHSSRESKAKARFKWLLHNWGLKKFLSAMERKLEKRFEEYDGPIFLKDNGHEGVQSQRQDGLYYVNVPLMGGNLTSEKMVTIADLADEYGNGDLRLTAVQNIIIPNVGRTDLLLKRLDDIGFSFNGSKLRWNSMGCASDFCGKTFTPHAKDITRDIVDHLERQYDSEQLDEAGFRIHVSGCPNNCCSNLIAEIGLAGKLTRESSGMKQSYDVLLRGGVGRTPSLGRRIEANVPAGELKYRIEGLITNYLKNKTTTERLRDYCNRCTIGELKSSLRSIEV